MANIIKRVWNQNRMVQIEDLKGMTFQAEQAGHTFQISGIDDDGNTVVLTGTPSGVLLRPDNTDVALTCSVSGGVVSATLPANCYDVPGRFGLTIFITSGSSKTAIYAAVGTVTRTSSGTVAPGTSQSVVDLINAINTAINSIPASYSALLADIAPTYSNSALYSVGQYAWYDGDLKRCIVPITTAESYTAAHWTSAVLGQDVSDLKSALNYVDNGIAVLLGTDIFDVSNATLVKKNAALISVGTKSVSIAANGIVTNGIHFVFSAEKYTDYQVVCLNPLNYTVAIKAAKSIPSSFSNNNVGSSTKVYTGDNTYIIVSFVVPLEQTAYYDFSSIAVIKNNKMEKIGMIDELNDIINYADGYNWTVQNIQGIVYYSTGNFSTSTDKYYAVPSTDRIKLPSKSMILFSTIAEGGVSVISKYNGVAAGPFIPLVNGSDATRKKDYYYQNASDNDIEIILCGDPNGGSLEWRIFDNCLPNSHITDEFETINNEIDNYLVDNIYSLENATVLQRYQTYSTVSGDSIIFAKAPAVNTVNVVIPVNKYSKYELTYETHLSGEYDFYHGIKFVDTIPSDYSSSGFDDTNKGFSGEHSYAVLYFRTNKDDLGSVTKIRLFESSGRKSLFPADFSSIAMFEHFGVVGDSYASGQIYNSGNVSIGTFYNLSWGQIIARKNGISCINFSSGGLSTRTWLTHSKGLPLVQSSDAQNLYILALGINDKSLGLEYIGTISDIHDDSSLNADTFYGNYGKIISAIKAKAPNAKLIISTLSGNSDEGSIAINQAIIEIANHFSIPYIVQYSYEFFKSRFYLNMQGGHPTAPIYAGMANALETLINECIYYNYSYFKDYTGQ